MPEAPVRASAPIKALSLGVDAGHTRTLGPSGTRSPIGTRSEDELDSEYPELDGLPRTKS
jgi:hypothetical protein